MKKTFAVVLAMALSLSLVSCGDSDGNASKSGVSSASQGGTAAQSQEDPYAVNTSTYVTIGTSGTGGTLAILGSAIASVVNEENPNIVMNVENTPSGGAGNVLAIGSKELEFGMATGADPYEAYMGMNSYSEEIKNLRMIATGLPFSMHVMVKEESSIQSPADFGGAKIAAVGSGGTRQAQDILKVMGYETNQYSMTTYTLGEACDALKDGTVELLICFTSAPAANIQDMTSSTAVRFIDCSEYVEQIMDAYASCVRSTISAGAYDGVDADLDTIAYPVTLFCGDYVDDAIVYQVTKAIMENNDKLVNIYANAGYFSLDNQKANLTEDILPPIHDGALAYYKSVDLFQ